MDKEVCRAFTFINYHIPATKNGDNLKYVTMGFFDGLMTEDIDLDYKEDGLEALWKYSMWKKKEGGGEYSHQTIFCFGKNEWNDITDREFWNENDTKYPLIFVVFLQLRRYFVTNENGESGIGQQCREFSKAAARQLGEFGKVYSYATIDKNDFVVCIKSDDYKVAVDAIRGLHETGSRVVYSYTIFSLAKKVLNEITDDKYHKLYEQTLDSICLKGITNSSYKNKYLPLDSKYRDFNKKLLEKLYTEEERLGDEELDNRVYDILGDDDFHIVAREVNLGRLLQMFSDDGLLDYHGERFRFYLFSSNLVLNVEMERHPKSEEERLEEEWKLFQGIPKDGGGTSDLCGEDNHEMPELCAELETRMANIRKRVEDFCRPEVNNGAFCEQVDEKTAFYCNAVIQLLHSLKALEKAPTKQYDLCSLYEGFSLLVDILEEKLTEKDAYIHVKESVNLYEYIHKISMTLHGTLRTDIRFFQIRDFNATIHYSPAKLRAFYAVWALELSGFYSYFKGNSQERYSFILSPGMFRGVAVRSLFDDPEESKKLMLITIPERQLYFPKRLCLVLAHEVSHFIGHTVRRRNSRYRAWLNCCTRVCAIEWKQYKRMVVEKSEIYEIKNYLDWIKDNTIFYNALSAITGNKFEEEEIRVGAVARNTEHEYYSRDAKSKIQMLFREIGWMHVAKLIEDERADLDDYLQANSGMVRKEFSKKSKMLLEFKDFERTLCSCLHTFYYKMVNGLLSSVVPIFIDICREGYADLMAILTLNLSSADYIFMVLKGEIENIDGSIGGEMDAPLIIVRLAVVINAVSELVAEKEGWFESIAPEFCRNWESDFLGDMYVSGDETKKNLIAKINGYRSHLVDKLKMIDTYESMYDSKTEEFQDKILDFLNDKLIFEEMVSYLKECAEEYLGMWMEDRAFFRDKKKLLEDYQRAANGTCVDLMQEIEDFLHNYEQTKIPKGKSCSDMGKKNKQTRDINIKEI